MTPLGAAILISLVVAILQPNKKRKARRRPRGSDRRGKSSTRHVACYDVVHYLKQ